MLPEPPRRKSGLRSTVLEEDARKLQTGANLNHAQVAMGCYCGSILASFASFAHFSISSRWSAVNCSRVPGKTSAPAV